MTRETKVGLVVGTGIILLIGIVVSDHLASQQRGQQQTAAPTGYTDLSTGSPARTIDPRGAVRPSDANKSIDLRNRDNTGNGNRTAAIELNNIARNPDGSAVTLPPGTPPNTGTTTPPNTGNTTPGGGIASLPGNNIDRNLPDNSTAIDRNLPPGLAADLRNNNLLPVDNTPRLANNGGFTDNHETNLPHNNNRVSNTNPPRHTEPLIHHVQEGETLWAIAEKFYGVGNGRYFAEIARANHDKLMPNGGVREGVRLVIPNKEIIVPGSPTNPGNHTRIEIVTPLPPVNNTNNIDPRLAPPIAPNNAVPALRTVTVEPGDALSTIASRELGSVRHMQLIINANKDQIRDANDIKAGMKLRMPSTPVATTPVTNPTTTPAILNAVPDRSTTERATIAPGVTVKVHKVQPRDTFTSIARTRLGSERRWKELFDLNKDKVRTADALREGIVLVLPADAR